MLNRICFILVILGLVYSVTVKKPQQQADSRASESKIEKERDGSFIVTPLDDESDIPENVPVRELSLIEVEDSSQHKKKLKKKRRELKEQQVKEFVVNNLGLDPVHEVNRVNKFIDNLQDKLYKQAKKHIEARKQLLEDYQDVLSAYHRLKQQGAKD